MGSEWRVVTLGEIAKFRAGSAFKKEYQGERTGELPFLKVSDLNLPGNEYFIRFANNWVSRDLARDIKATHHPKGATVFAKIGVALTTNRRRLLIQESLIDNNLMSATPDEALVRPRYLYFLLCTVDFNVVAKGSALPYLNAGDLKSLRVVLPGLSTQDEVLEVLEAIEDRIDNIFLVNEALEAIAQALFKSWFVDFDPVRAKVEGREPEGMDAATANLFPDSLVDSELGAIPEGWQIEQIGDLVDCLGGGTPSTKNEAFWDGGEHHWATPKDLSGLQAPVLSSTARKITDAGVARISSGLLPAGTLLMSSRAPIGYLAIAAVPTAINQGFIAIPPGGALPPAYLLFWAKTNMDLIKQKANGSTFMEISRRAFRPIQVLLPPPGILDAFMTIVGPSLDRIQENERHGAVLAETRDTLLPRLISGRLRLPDVEEAIEVATA